MYVDGFNFYYAIKRQSRTIPIHLGWCDFGKLAQRMIEPGASIRAVKYFTAPVADLGEPGGVAGGESARQAMWLNAVRTMPGLTVIEGFHRRGDDSSAPHAPKKKREEKQTDVNIAVNMLVDAAKNVCNRLLLVTGDQDQIPAVTAVRREFGKPVDVWLPPTDGSRIPLAWQVIAANEGVRVRVITAAMLSASRLPDRIEMQGQVIEAPTIWRAPNRHQ
jgi:hypothetical protein